MQRMKPNKESLEKILEAERAARAEESEHPTSPTDAQALAAHIPTAPSRLEKAPRRKAMPGDLRCRGGRGLELPDVIEVGPLVTLCSTTIAAHVFRMVDKTATIFLKSLGIPLIYFGKKKYYNLYSLRHSLFVLLHPGGMSFAAPGSYAAHNPDRYPDTLRNLTPETLDILSAYTKDWNIEVLREVLSYANIQRAGIKINAAMNKTTHRGLNSLQDLINLQRASERRTGQEEKK